MQSNIRWKYRLGWISLLGLAYAVGCSNENVAKNLVKLYPESVSFTARNTLDVARMDETLIVNIDQIRSAKGDFNPTNIVVLCGKNELPSQAVDTDGDGDSDQLVISTDFASGEGKNITIRYNSSGSSRRNYDQRAQAEISIKTGGEFIDRKYIGGEFANVNRLEVPAEHTDHSNYIRYEGPGWESDKVGYRYYLDWRNAIDIFGKKTSAMILQNVGQDGFDSYHAPAPWGMDILKVGGSLGIGSIGMWVDDKAERVAETSNLVATITANGPVRAAVLTDYAGWLVGDNTYNLVSHMMISSGSRLTEHHLRISPMPENLCTGLVKHPDAIVFSDKDNTGEWTYLASYGTQSLVHDNLGMAIIYSNDQLIELTADEYSDVVVLKPIDGGLTYYFLAAWEQELDGLVDEEAFRIYLDEEIDKLNSPIEITW